jgi:molecular chaperone HscB
MSDPFTVLGVPRRFRLDLRDVEQRYRDLSRALHPDKHAQASPAERRLAAEKSAEANEALRKLKDPQSRAAALLAAVGRTLEENTRAEPELLTKMLELREQLEETRAVREGREESVAKLRGDVEREVHAAEQAIADAFDGAREPASDAIDRAFASLVALRYLYRFLEEADAIVET